MSDNIPMMSKMFLARQVEQRYQIQLHKLWTISQAVQALLQTQPLH